jgi:protein O-GlcNAc transferase
VERLPVLTQIGETFAVRDAAGLLTAIGLPELIVRTQNEFESLAIALATERERLAAIKHRLAQNRGTMPLFDTRRYTRYLETACETMHRRQRDGLAPEHIYIWDA